jgi:hypothetical protein
VRVGRLGHTYNNNNKRGLFVAVWCVSGSGGLERERGEKKELKADGKAI